MWRIGYDADRLQEQSRARIIKVDANIDLAVAG
jgi:hypothetical protein